MRTTVTLDDGVFRQAKAHAALAGRSLGSVIEDALRRYLMAPAPASPVPVDLPSFDLGAVRDGIDIDDTSAVLDTLDRIDDSRAQPRT